MAIGLEHSFVVPTSESGGRKFDVVFKFCYFLRIMLKIIKADVLAYKTAYIDYNFPGASCFRCFVFNVER